MSEHVNKAHRVGIVGYAEVAALFILLNIARTYDDNYLRLILKLKKHTELTVGLKSRKHAGCVIIIVKLTSEFKIELASKAVDALPYLFGLKLQIFIVINSKPDVSLIVPPP
jgi:hypothetical protein